MSTVPSSVELGRRTGDGGLAIYAWACVAAILLAVRVFPDVRPGLEHDSFQYLSVAENILRGHLLGATSLIHYDVERSFGVVPAPLVTFPSGYPWLIAVASLTGLSVEHAALLISVLAVVGNVPLLAWIARRLEFSRALQHAVLGGYVLNSVVIEFGATIMTEAAFSFFVLLGVAGLLYARLHPRGGWLPWLGAGIVFGLAYFVRYVGLFFVGGLALVVLRHGSRGTRGRTLTIRHGIALAAASAVVLLGVARNLWLVGNWRGRDEMAVAGSAVRVIAKTLDAMNALFLGPSAGPGGYTFPLKGLLCAGLLVAVALLAWHWVRRRANGPAAARPDVGGFRVDLAVLLAAYVGCMLYAGMTSSISYGLARNFVPVLPLLLLVLGIVLQRGLEALPAGGASSATVRVALAGAFAIYAVLHLLAARSPLDDRRTIVERRLDEPAADGRTARSVVSKLAGPRGAIIANNGQAVGHVLARPTISLVGPAFSEVRWDEAAVQDTVRRFRIAAVVVSLPVPGETESDETPSDFIRRLEHGEAPAWLRLAFRSPYQVVYAPLAGY